MTYWQRNQAPEFIPSDDPFSFGEQKNKQKAFLCSIVEISGSHFNRDHRHYFPSALWVAPEDKSRQWFIGALISLFICPGPKPRDSFILIPEHWPQNHLISVIRKVALTCLNVLPESNAGGHATIWLMISLSVMNPVKRNQVCSNLKGLSGRQAQFNTLVPIQNYSAHTPLPNSSLHPFQRWSYLDHVLLCL